MTPTITELNATFEFIRSHHECDYDAMIAAAHTHGCTLADPADEAYGAETALVYCNGEAVARAWWGGHPSDRGFDDQTDI